MSQDVVSQSSAKLGMHSHTGYIVWLARELDNPLLDSTQQVSLLAIPHLLLDILIPVSVILVAGTLPSSLIVDPSC